jgi:hypothetical protein
LATSSARYRIHVDLDYEGKHAEAGSIVSNLPSTSLAWLKASNYVTLIPKGGKAEDYPQLDPRTGAPVAAAPSPPEPGAEAHVAAGAEPAPPEQAHPDPDSLSYAGVPTPGVPSAHPALEPAEPTELADQPEPERRGRARKKAPPSTTPDPDSEQRIPEPDEPPPAEPPADTSDTEQEEG